MLVFFLLQLGVLPSVGASDAIHKASSPSDQVRANLSLFLFAIQPSFCLLHPLILDYAPVAVVLPSHTSPTSALALPGCDTHNVWPVVFTCVLLAVCCPEKSTSLTLVVRMRRWLRWVLEIDSRN